MREGELGLVEVEQTNGTVIVRLQGEFDLSNSAQVEGALLNAVDEARSIVIDLSATTFVDSSVVRALIRPTRSENLHVALVVPEANTAVHRVVTLMGLDGFFEVYTDVSTAVASLA
jgi:anti-sigma B factor antagonist